MEHEASALNAEETRRLFETLESPPRPSERAKAAARDYLRAVGRHPEGKGA